ncbi:hypothetical protein Acsp01_47540 [Actinoplanes sp. NBRC 101535]|nr:hypothetical protein Acsp01_47540 [Actinoplanes sp. NBRC 101535]
MTGMRRLTLWLTFAAEIGHLVAAWVDARGWPLISGFHVVIACCWGLLFAGLHEPVPRARTIGRARSLATALPVLYLLSHTVGLPTLLTFTRLPVDKTGIVVTAIEVVLLIVLLRLRQGSPAEPRKPRQPYGSPRWGRPDALTAVFGAGSDDPAGRRGVTDLTAGLVVDREGRESDCEPRDLQKRPPRSSAKPAGAGRNGVGSGVPFPTSRQTGNEGTAQVARGRSWVWGGGGCGGPLRSEP